MASRSKRAVVGAAALTALLTYATVAPATGPNRCLPGKTRCASQKAQGLLQCHIVAERDGTAVDPGCVQRVMTHFSGDADQPSCFATLETGEDRSNPQTTCATH